MFSNCFSQEEKYLQCDMKFYLPSVFGIACGYNAKFGLRENYEDVEKCINIMVEDRFFLITNDIFSFSTSIAFGSYFENSENKENDLDSINLSFGTGFYIHPFDILESDLRGFCFYLYPAYQIPIYTWNFEPYLKWKMAFDLGYNFVFGNIFSVYPYMRNVFGWNSSDFRYGFDLGIAIGIYIDDRNYY